MCKYKCVPRRMYIVGYFDQSGVCVLCMSFSTLLPQATKMADRKWVAEVEKISKLCVTKGEICSKVVQTKEAASSKSKCRRDEVERFLDA